MSPESYFTDDLPEDARALLEQAEADLTEVQAHAETEVAEIRARADRVIDEARRRAEEEIGEVRGRGGRQAAERTRQLLEGLRPLQAAYVKEGKLDEALAIRDRARQLRARLLNVRPDPGTLAEFQPDDGGTELLFDVTGNTDGTIWGSEVYTSDSRLATAAVHAGVLRNGERGVVRVTMLDGLNVAFTGSERNGVFSEDYGDYPTAFRVSRP
jgi:ElaB/YqjD/DUF883 family membrane-anchored ribosome-binding protein